MLKHDKAVTVSNTAKTLPIGRTHLTRLTAGNSSHILSTRLCCAQRLRKYRPTSSERLEEGGDESLLGGIFLPDTMNFFQRTEVKTAR